MREHVAEPGFVPRRGQPLPAAVAQEFGLRHAQLGDALEFVGRQADPGIASPGHRLHRPRRDQTAALAVAEPHGLGAEAGRHARRGFEQEAEHTVLADVAGVRDGQIQAGQPLVPGPQIRLELRRRRRCAQREGAVRGVVGKPVLAEHFEHQCGDVLAAAADRAAAIGIGNRAAALREQAEAAAVGIDGIALDQAEQDAGGILGAVVLLHHAAAVDIIQPTFEHGGAEYATEVEPR